MDKGDFTKVANPTLRMLFESKKEKSEVRSLSGASVADMIFKKVPAKNIAAQIMD